MGSGPGDIAVALTVPLGRTALPDLPLVLPGHLLISLYLHPFLTLLVRGEPNEDICGCVLSRV